MNLPFLKKKPQAEYFITLLLHDEKISALVVEQIDKKITIIGRQEAWFTTSLEEIPASELISLIDKAISEAESTLPADVDPQNTIFGVKDSWVEDKKIKKEYLAKLKKICEHLSLTPMGFIVIAEAVAHLIQKEEGAPLSALITEIGQHTITVSLFRASKLIEVKHGIIEETPMKTVDNLLKSFEQVEIFPSRIILFNIGSSTEEKHHDTLAQKFISHQWSKGLPFLHVPQVSILPAGFDNKAIVFGAATQLGFEFAGLPLDTSDIKTYERHHVVSSEKVVEKEIKEEEELGKKEPVQQLEEKEPRENKKQVVDDQELLETVPADNFGFVKNQDISTLPKQSPVKQAVPHKKTSEHPLHPPLHKHQDEIEEHEDTEEYEEPTESSKSNPFNIGALLAPLKNLRLPIPHVRGGGKLMFIPPIVLLAAVGLILLYVFQLKATVTLLVAPKAVDETQKITFSTSGNNDFSSNILAAKNVSVSLDGTATTEATGQKEVGEKAKGTITIYNSDTGKKTLQSGSSVTSSNGLVFLLDKDVSVASASGDIFTGIKSGTAQVAVTAKNIGSDYNLPSNTKFSIEGSSVLAAKNDSAFSGGSKKKVTVVAKKDVDKLTTELPKSLEQKAKTALQGKLSGNEVAMPGFASMEFEKKALDHDIDKEAKQVKLTATVTFTTMAYSKEDLTQYSQTILKNKFSQDQTIPEDKITTEISGIKRKDEKETNAVLTIKAGLMPKLDNPKIAKEITGKSFTEVDEYIRELPQVEKVDIALAPNLPFLPKILPRMTDNITVIIKPNE